MRQPPDMLRLLYRRGRMMWVVDVILHARTRPVSQWLPAARVVFPLYSIERGVAEDLAL